MITEIGYQPLEAFQKLRHLSNIVFLDSSRFHPKHGRYSILAADPQLQIRSESGTTSIQTRSSPFAIHGDPWEVLDAMLSKFRIFEAQKMFGFPLGAAIGFFSYEMGRWLETLPPSRPNLIPTPEMWFGFYDVILIFDHLEKKGWLVSSGLDSNGICSQAQAAFRRDQFLDELQSDVLLFPTRHANSHQIAPLVSREDYENAVRKALEYIRAGDVYQVNLSHPFLGTVSESPQDLYSMLRISNPAPFSAYADFGTGQILSSSPERFLKLDRRAVQSRPIKGTCARIGNAQIDWQEAEKLIQSAKNRSELLMITDLLRNDLGKTAEFGSVTVPDLLTCEEYETVYHLVSTIEAKLRPDMLHLDAIAACFPGGSITGTPKRRSMEIIHELEPWGRGIYTGSLGYIGFNGVSDFNILIRTLVHHEGTACFHVGAGIVADSDPQSEYEETLYKARGLLKLWEESTKLSKTASL
jgi:para-aminobenzoate synthetase component I